MLAHMFGCDVHSAGHVICTQAAVAALEHLQNAKPEDIYQQLVGAVGAVASMAAENAVANMGHDGVLSLDMGDGGVEASPAGGGDKPLTSRYRWGQICGINA